MPVFKAFFAIAKKRRNAALIYLGVYAVITLLSALSQDSINENFKASQRSIAITDEDNTDASRALCDYLASIHQVTTPEPGEDTALSTMPWSSRKDLKTGCSPARPKTLSPP